jgi:hypothetical protein
MHISELKCESSSEVGNMPSSELNPVSNSEPGILSVPETGSVLTSVLWFLPVMIYSIYLNVI